MESFPPLAAPGRERPARGFTLVEMLVVLALIGILSVVVLVGQGNFDNTLSITDTAYTIALSIREAQTFGLSSRTKGGVNDAAYGVHFSGTLPAKNYTLFADISPVAPGSSSAYCPGHTAAAGSPDAKPGNCLYDSATELVQTFTFNRGYTLTDICGKDTGGVQRCASTSYLTGLELLYLRPNTDSVVVGLTNSGPIPLTNAQITLSSPEGAHRAICVSSVGEVSVAATISACP